MFYYIFSAILLKNKYLLACVWKIFHQHRKSYEYWVSLFHAALSDPTFLRFQILSDFAVKKFPPTPPPPPQGNKTMRRNDPENSFGHVHFEGVFSAVTGVKIMIQTNLEWMNNRTTLEWMLLTARNECQLASYCLYSTFFSLDQALIFHWVGSRFAISDLSKALRLFPQFPLAFLTLHDSIVLSIFLLNFCSKLNPSIYLENLLSCKLCLSSIECNRHL